VSIKKSSWVQFNIKQQRSQFQGHGRKKKNKEKTDVLDPNIDNWHTTRRQALNNSNRRKLFGNPIPAMVEVQLASLTQPPRLLTRNQGDHKSSIDMPQDQANKRHGFITIISWARTILLSSQFDYGRVEHFVLATFVGRLQYRGRAHRAESGAKCLVEW
jgi:hypothetical protein